MTVAVVTALLVSLALQPLVIAALRHRDVLDHPTDRSSHAVPTPRGGGVAVVAGLLAGAMLAGLDSDTTRLLLTAGLAGLIGLAEDVRGIPIVPRLLLLLAVGAPVAVACSTATVGGIVAGAVVLLGVVAVVNAVNFMDGINGISSAQGVAGGAAYALVALAVDQPHLAAVSLAVAGASAGFAPYNVPRARVFLGDCGSYALGAALAGVAGLLWAAGAPPEAVVGPMAVYLADTGTTLVRRIRAREPWHLPHRTHVYQRLTDAGWSHTRVSLVVFVLIVACSLLGTLSFASWPTRVLADAAMLAVVLGYLALPGLLGGRRGDGSPRVLLVTHYFPPEVGAPQARLSEMARAWAADGADVTVLTGMPNHPTGVIPPDYRRALARDENVDGYRVLRTWLYATPNEGVLKKTLGHLSFMATAVLFGAARTGPTDVVVVSSPTFFSIGAAWVIARLRRAALVVEVRDLWPAIFVELGVLTNRRVIWILEHLELAAYRAADAVVVVSEGFRAHIVARGIPAEKVYTIRNGVDVERFTGNAKADESVRQWLGAHRGEVLVLYIGAHGISQGLSSVAEAAALLGDVSIHLAFVGEGANKAHLRATVERLGVANITMLPAIPRDDVPAVLAAADICLVPLRDVPLFSTFIPSKIFEYLAAEKAVVGSLRGEPGRILEAAGALVVEPEQPVALAAALRELAGDPARRRVMGEAGRRHVLEHFDRSSLAREYLALIESVGR